MDPRDGLIGSLVVLGAGYPADMVTDTALFRYPHYHSGEDTWDKIDYDRTARVVGGLARVVSDLAAAAG